MQANASKLLYSVEHAVFESYARIPSEAAAAAIIPAKIESVLAIRTDGFSNSIT